MSSVLTEPCHARRFRPGTVVAGREMNASTVINNVLRRVPAWPIYPIGLGYALWLLWLGIDNRLGAEPVKALEHKLGEAALYLMVAVIAVTPLRNFTGITLVTFRRALGVTCFAFVVLHLLTWAVLDVQRLDRVWADIVKRPYITVGMVALMLMLPLAVTSNNWFVRKLGPMAWRRLHKLTHLAAVLGAVHYLMLVKGWQIRPMVFLTIVVVLLVLRMRPRRTATPRQV